MVRLSNFVFIIGRVSLKLDIVKYQYECIESQRISSRMNLFYFLF